MYGLLVRQKRTAELSNYISTEHTLCVILHSINVCCFRGPRGPRCNFMSSFSVSACSKHITSRCPYLSDSPVFVFIYFAVLRTHTTNDTSTHSTKKKEERDTVNEDDASTCNSEGVNRFVVDYASLLLLNKNIRVNTHFNIAGIVHCRMYSTKCNIPTIIRSYEYSVFVFLCLTRAARVVPGEPLL